MILRFGPFGDCPLKTPSQPTTPVPWEAPAYQAVLDTTDRDNQDQPGKAGGTALREARSEHEDAPGAGSSAERLLPTPRDTVFPLRKTVRQRNKVHLAFVAAQPCRALLVLAV